MGSQLLLHVLRDEPILKNVDFQSVADTRGEVEQVEQGASGTRGEWSKWNKEQVRSKWNKETHQYISIESYCHQGRRHTC